MKVVDDKAVFPVSEIVVNSLVNEEQITILERESFIENKKDVYDTLELTHVKSALDEAEIDYTVTELPPVNIPEITTLNFNNKDELLNYINNGVQPKKTIGQLEDEIRLLEDTLLTIMFSGVDI